MTTIAEMRKKFNNLPKHDSVAHDKKMHGLKLAFHKYNNDQLKFTNAEILISGVNQNVKDTQTKLLDCLVTTKSSKESGIELGVTVGDCKTACTTALGEYKNQYNSLIDSLGATKDLNGGVTPFYELTCDIFDDVVANNVTALTTAGVDSSLDL